MAVYHSTKALLEGLVALAASCSSKLELKTLNTTNDGWPLRSASIGSGPTKVLLSFGIHGREYMTSEIAMNFLTRLCSGDEHKLLNDVTFTTIPVFNPDGRARTDAALGLGTGIRDQSCGDRRKNGKFVDLNRNSKPAHCVGYLSLATRAGKYTFGMRYALPRCGHAQG